MIISDSKQFVFIHNPKCAGTSFRSALVSYDTTGLLFARHDTWNGYKVETTHLPLFMMQANYPVYFRKLESYFSFMVVRNPFTRFVSAFNEINESVYNDFKQSGDVSRYRYEINRFAAELSADSLRGWDFALRHFVPQAEFAFIGPKNYVDALIRFEDLTRGYDRIGLFRHEIAEVLRRAPAQRARPVRTPLGDLLDPSTVRKLLVIYDRDFVLFEYDQFLPPA